MILVRTTSIQNNRMTEFWDRNFREKREMWGFTPTRSAVAAAGVFAEDGLKNILIPGIGYGRNAQAFLQKGMEVTGIEISETAIGMARKHYGPDLKIVHGSVTEMPFDDAVYDGIFCHALIHLLDGNGRTKLIGDCYDQLSENGRMIFTAISKKSPTYGQGTEIGKDRFEQFGGVNMFFYDEDSIREAFGHYGLSVIREIDENFPFYWIECVKKEEDVFPLFELLKCP